MSRRDKTPDGKGRKGASVIKGLRMERGLAQRVCEQADERAAGDVAEFTRYAIRVGLGCSHEEANSREANEYHINSGLAGLSLDKFTKRELEHRAAKLGVTKASVARHLIRLAVGYAVAESNEREKRFSALADAYKTLHEETE